MQMQYDELDYHRPLITPEAAAGRALAILRDAQKTDPAFLVYLLNYSTLLLLAGLRAESPYCTFPPDFIATKFDAFKALLAKHDIVIIEEWSAYEEPSGAYSLLHKKAFAEIPEIYGITKPFWKVPVAYTAKDYIEWTEYTRFKIVQLMEDGTLPGRWLRDWWAPHNICFGMLLGYPGEAISSFCHDQAAHREDGAEPPCIQQWLPRDDFFGTAVGYDIEAKVQKFEGPTKQFALWTAVIGMITAEFDTKSVLAIPEAATEYEAYKQYDKEYTAQVVAGFVD